MRIKHNAAFSLFASIFVIGCHTPRPAPEAPTSASTEPVLRQDGLALYQLACPEFDALTPQLQRYAYYLCRAALAGRDVLFDQRAPRSLEIRRMLDALTAAEGLDQAFATKLRRYAVRFWSANGNYDVETSRKFVPEFSFDELAGAVRIARAGDERLPPDAILTDLRPYIFDPDFRPVLVNKSPFQGDAVTASAVNLYDRGIARAQVEAYPSHYGLNGRFAQAGGVLVEEVYRAGTPDVPPGRMAAAMRRMIGELETALSFAPDESRPALRALIEFFRTGDGEAFDRHCRLWVQDHRSPVDYIIGFIEVYSDPLARRGSFEGLVFIEDSAATRVMKALAVDAAWFEARMPWEDLFKKKEFTPPTARAFKVLIATGDGGPRCPSGINLPNDQHLRETVGTKNFLLTNVMQSGAEDRSRRLFDEFLPTASERESALAHFDERRTAMVALHEVVGHGSGRRSPDLKGDPSDYLKEFDSTLEEARADLVAYWFIGDQHLTELGITSVGVTHESAYRAMLAGSLIHLRDVPEGNQFEEDHARAGHLIASYIIVRGGAALETVGGKRFVRLTDLDKAQDAVGELLAEIQRIKGTGDYAAAKKLVETYGIKFDPALRDEVIARVKPLDIPDRIAFVMPEVEPLHNKMGGIEAFQIIYPRDFVGQMMRFGKEKD